MFCKKGVLINFKYLQENTCVVVSSLIGLKACNFIKNSLQHSYFLVNIAKLLRIPILKNICERLLLDSGTYLRHSHLWKILWKRLTYLAVNIFFSKSLILYIWQVPQYFSVIPCTFNSFMTYSLYIETRSLVCKANQWAGFCMIGPFVIKELNKLSAWFKFLIWHSWLRIWHYWP